LGFFQLARFTARCQRVFRSRIVAVLMLTGCGPIEPQWLLAESGVATDLLAIHGSSANNVWAVGRAGVVLRFDGQKWERVETGLPTTFSGVYVAAPNDVWVVGEEGVMLRWQGAGFTRVNHSSSDYRAVLGTGSNDVYFASSSFAEHWNGASITTLEYAQSGSSYGVSATQLTGGPGGIWTTASGYVYRLYPTTAEKLRFDTSGSWDVAVVGSDAFWVFDNGYEGKALRADGSTWVTVDFPRQGTFSAQQVVGGWANSATDVWFIGSQGGLWQWDGRTVRTTANNTPMRGLWGNVNDMWAVGEGGTLARRFAP
jgi:hypothetical protein